MNPVFRVGAQIEEALRYHRPAYATAAEVIRLLKLVGIPAPEARLRSYPHELSGGMQQRIMIAMALASRPKLLIADEPTTALDVTIQAQIIELLSGLREQLGMAILLITHNLGLVSELADDVAVMYAGQIVESGPAPDVLLAPASSLHPGAVAVRASDRCDQRVGHPFLAAPRCPGLSRADAAYHPRCAFRFEAACTVSSTAPAAIPATGRCVARSRRRLR